MAPDLDCGATPCAALCEEAYRQGRERMLPLEPAISEALEGIVVVEEGGMSPAPTSESTSGPGGARRRRGHVIQGCRATK